MERTIAVLNDVKDLSELLHGAQVHHARMIPSGGRLRMEIELTHACIEGPSTPQGLSGHAKVPWVKSRLSLGQIKDADIQRLSHAPPAQAALLSCEAVAGGYTLVVTSPDGLRIVLALEQLNGQFTDLGQPTGSVSTSEMRRQR